MFLGGAYILEAVLQMETVSKTKIRTGSVLVTQTELYIFTEVFV